MFPTAQYGSRKRAERARPDGAPSRLQSERPQPSSLPHQHAPQSVAAVAATEPLRRRARRLRERFVATGTVAEKNLEITPTLIALAPRLRDVLGAVIGGPILTTLLAVTARLLAAALLALLGVAIAMVGAMSRPATRRVAATAAAVAIERMRRALGALAALQQADSLPRLTA